MALRQNFALAIRPLCLPTLGRKLVGKVVLFISRKHLHVLPELICLRRATCLSYSSFLRWKIWLNPWRDKITCPAFGLYASPAEYSTMGHIVLDLSGLACQPNSRERSARPKKRVTFAVSEQKSAYPAHLRELDEDEDDKPLVRPNRTAVSEDEDDKPLVQPASREERVRRESAAERRVTAQLRRTEEVSILNRNPDGEALLNIINKLSDEKKLRTFTWSTTICPPPSSRRGQLTRTFLERFMTFTSMWWWRAHSAIRQSRDLIDHAWADWELKQLEILSFWITVRQQLEIKPFGFWLFSMEPHHI